MGLSRSGEIGPKNPDLRGTGVCVQNKVDFSCQTESAFIYCSGVSTQHKRVLTAL